MDKRNGIEKILTDFLIELKDYPLDCLADENTPPKMGYVDSNHYYIKFKISNFDLHELIDCVLMDRYIHVIQKSELRNQTTSNVLIEISLNLRGKEFIKTGGYVQQKIDNKKEKKKDIRTTLWIALISVAVGSLLTGLIEYLKDSRVQHQEFYIGIPLSCPKVDSIYQKSACKDSVATKR